MNQFIKLVCLSITLIAPAHAMQDDAELGRQLRIAAQWGNDEKIKQLIEAGAPVDYPDADGKTPLLFAAGMGHLDCIQLLLAAGAQVNHQNIRSATALAMAIQYNHVPCIKALIAAGAQVNLANSNGSTPLMVAAKNGHVPCAKALIAAGAQVNLANNEGWTALMFATINDHQPICELFIDAMLWITNQKQKAGMATFLGIKSRKILFPYVLDGYLRNQFKASWPAAVYENNKQNFASSFAYQELMRIKALPEMQGPVCTKRIEALLEKYNPGENNSNSQSWCTVQ